jgi:hypothetical protein
MEQQKLMDSLSDDIKELLRLEFAAEAEAEKVRKTNLSAKSKLTKYLDDQKAAWDATQKTKNPLKPLQSGKQGRY